MSLHYYEHCCNYCKAYQKGISDNIWVEMIQLQPCLLHLNCRSTVLGKSRPPKTNTSKTVQYIICFLMINKNICITRNTNNIEQRNGKKMPNCPIIIVYVLSMVFRTLCRKKNEWTYSLPKAMEQKGRLICVCCTMKIFGLDQNIWGERSEFHLLFDGIFNLIH